MHDELEMNLTGVEAQISDVTFHLQRLEVKLDSLIEVGRYLGALAFYRLMLDSAEGQLPADDSPEVRAEKLRILQARFLGRVPVPPWEDPEEKASNG